MSTHPAESITQFFVLHGRESSLVLETRTGEAPLWRYWGARLPDPADYPAVLA